MKSTIAAEYEMRLNTGAALPPRSQNAHAGVAILIDDPINRRLVESASTHLELLPEILSPDLLDPDVVDPQAFDLGSLSRFELVIAEERLVPALRALLSSRDEHGDGLTPGLIAVSYAGHEAARPEAPKAEAPDTASPPDSLHDGVLRLPMQTGPLAAQLSLLLYARRAFARRYQSELEELHLNRRIFRSVTSGISVASASQPDLPLTYVNPAFEAMTGYALEEVQGKNCRFLQGPEPDQPGIALIREAIRDRREVTTILKNFRKDGTSFWNELSLSPIRNRDGDLTHFVGIQTDVTARVEFESALRESEKLAAVGRLASAIAHEINNPLESITNLLYLAQRSDALDEVRSYLGQADKELQRVALITSQSLRFYRQSTRPQAILGTDLLESLLDLYESRAQNSNVTIERSDRSHESVVCLESEIRQVLSNLVRNAIEAMHGRGGRLIIRTRDATQGSTGRKGIAITIADTGAGISPQTMRQMYKPFFTTKGAAGTGLGLWISSGIVDRHQGYLRFRSSQRPTASGSVFMLFLPLQGSAQ